MSDVHGLLRSQRRYYDLRADDYGVKSRPADRKVRGAIPTDLARALVDELRPEGRVLEIACGPGGFTAELVRHAASVTALDGSARMLERNASLVADPKVSYVHADVFDWRPDRGYDVVFFGFWLSHVPPQSFDAFWDVVAACLRPGGRVGFVDEDQRASGHDDVRVVDGVPIATRRLADGRAFDVVKVFWDAGELGRRLRASGWDVDVRRAGETFLFGAGRRA